MPDVVSLSPYGVLLRPAISYGPGPIADSPLGGPLSDLPWALRCLISGLELAVGPFTPPQAIRRLLCF